MHVSLAIRGGYVPEKSQTSDNKKGHFRPKLGEIDLKILSLFAQVRK